MIASLRGIVQALGLDRVVLDVGGVGFQVLATPATLAKLRVGGTAQLLISMLVREDALTLYGFESADEREAFDIVRSINGIGPKTALALLATLEPADLYRAVRDQNVKAIQAVPGIGAKIASRVLLELGGRLPPMTEGDGAPASASDASVQSQVIAALVSLGYSAKVADDVVAKVVAEDETPVEDAAPLLRAALRMIGGKACLTPDRANSSVGPTLPLDPTARNAPS